MPSNWLCGDKFGQVMPHHASVRALWELKWKPLCAMNAYPFYYATVDDMDPVVDDLERQDINDAYTDAWTETFVPHLDALEKRAQEAEAAGSLKEAENLYLRAANLCMIARFPIITTPLKRAVFSRQQALYLHGTSFWANPVHAQSIAHTHGTDADGPLIPLFVQAPLTPQPSRPSPVFITLTGLDAYRTDVSPRISARATALGFTHIALEITGTGSAPGDASDPRAGDRQLASVLDWIASQPDRFDAAKVVLRGMSTGGYDALRAAHVHADRLALVFAHGAPSDRAFGREWLDQVDGGEYPTPIAEALRRRLGFQSVEEMKMGARDRWSLVRTGILDGKCARTVLLNGIDDTIFPIEDSIAALRHGAPKVARFFDGAGHMGEPGATPVVNAMLEDFIKGK